MFTAETARRTCLLAIFLFSAVATAGGQSGCPQLQQRVAIINNQQTILVGFKYGRNIVYSVQNLPSDAQDQVRRALNAISGNNPLHVTYQENTTTYDVPALSFQTGIAQDSGDNHAAINNKNVDSNGYTLSAVVTIDYYNQGAIGTPPWNGKWFDSTAQGYDTAISKVTNHEMGEFMFGMDDAPIGLGSCAGQTAGASNLNVFCGVNDSANNLPDGYSPTGCDMSYITNNNPQITPPPCYPPVNCDNWNSDTCTCDELPACTYWYSTSSTGEYNRVPNGGGLTCAIVYREDIYSCSGGMQRSLGPFYESEICQYSWPYCETNDECIDRGFDYCSGGNCYREEHPPVCTFEEEQYCLPYTCTWDAFQGQAWCGDTPILISLGSGEIKLSSPSQGVLFDLASTGTKGRYSWPEADSGVGFLVLDRNGNGLIDDGSEMFGNATPQPDSPRKNGFLALAEFDQTQYGGNGDGVIDAQDIVFSLLRVWMDENRDGISQPEELHSLSSLGIVFISLDYRLARRTDQFGNIFRYRTKMGTEKKVIAAPFAWDVILLGDTPQPPRH